MEFLRRPKKKQKFANIWFYRIRRVWHICCKAMNLHCQGFDVLQPKEKRWTTWKFRPHWQIEVADPCVRQITFSVVEVHIHIYYGRKMTGGRKRRHLWVPKKGGKFWRLMGNILDTDTVIKDVVVAELLNVKSKVMRKSSHQEFIVQSSQSNFRSGNLSNSF